MGGFMSTRWGGVATLSNGPRASSSRLRIVQARRNIGRSATTLSVGDELVGMAIWDSMSSWWPTSLVRVPSMWRSSRSSLARNVSTNLAQVARVSDLPEAGLPNTERGTDRSCHHEGDQDSRSARRAGKHRRAISREASADALADVSTARGYRDRGGAAGAGVDAKMGNGCNTGCVTSSFQLTVTEKSNELVVKIVTKCNPTIRRA